MSTVAGSAVATPLIVAGVVPALQKTAEIATIQTAASVIVTAILCPFITSWVGKQRGAPNFEKEAVLKGNALSESK